MRQPTELLILWDRRDAPAASGGVVYRWEGHADDEAAHSILRYAEQHGERLRSKYLAWAHSIGESIVDGRRLIDHLELEAGLSYWWLTGFVEKSPYRAPITDVIRLFAVEEIIERVRPMRLRLVSEHAGLAAVLEDLCCQRGTEFQWEHTVGAAAPQPRRRHQSLALRALVRHLRIARPYRSGKRSHWFAGSRAVFLCDYFVNVVPEEAEQGRFQSRYWEGLVGLIRQQGRLANWLHHNVRPPARAAIEWTSRFNERPDEQGYHRFLDAYMTWGVVWRVVCRWRHLCRLHRRLGNIKVSFRAAESGLSLWPLVREDWTDSLTGAGAIANLLAVELFDAALKDLPRQELGLYLCENNSWERALVHAWRKHQHGRLVAVAHSTVRFWDLRYFTDPRDLSTPQAVNALPQPDVTALNGTPAVEGYLNAGVPRDAIVECEAVRYLHLNATTSARSTIAADDSEFRVLVIGDIMPSYTIGMLRLLETAVARHNCSARFTVKPHPACPVRAEDYPGLRLTVETKPLGSLLTEVDLAFASSTTSGAVDAWLAGSPIVVMLDESQLNFSPLRGQQGVRFVSTAEDLADALQGPPSPETRFGRPDNKFFHLDPELSRWRTIITPTETSAASSHLTLSTD